MSARYESRREETDFSVLDYLTGNTELNPYGRPEEDGSGSRELARVIRDLNLANLVEMPVGNLSNGQTRRARIAKALLGMPEVLLLDEPFMGLDPPTQAALSPLLFDLARASSPRLLLALRPQDPVPDWITHLIYLNPSLHVQYQGIKEEVLGKLVVRMAESLPAKIFPQTISPVSDLIKGTTVYPEPYNGLGEPIVQMKDVIIKYGDKKVMGGWKQEINGEIRAGLDWTVRKGERWGVFGPNGSGKTTLISLICSDHPQAYSLPIKMFGRGRLPQPGQPGISIFDIQARIGQSSPEIHAFFPRNLTIRRTIENAWADTFLGIPKLTPQHGEIVESVLRWFEPDLNPMYATPNRERRAVIAQPWKKTEWADKIRFRDISFSSQRLALFLRAIVKRPELIVLDEAFGGMDEAVRDKCMLFMTWGTSRSCYHDQRGEGQQLSTGQADDLSAIRIRGLDEDQTLICVSHVKEEVPDVVRSWMCLPEAGQGKPARFGRLHAPLKNDEAQWREIWGM
ncbi:ABC transporter ATP-binding protein modF [Physcia stellaris]|nr:ABC transporter ATP-binding protein modF [Physcia stellaris]